MSEVLSIVDSVAGLISISAEIRSVLKSINKCSKQVPPSISYLMRETKDMAGVLCQVQMFTAGTLQIKNHSGLTMLSVHDLVAILSGCVLNYSKLHKFLYGVVGINDPSFIPADLSKAGLLYDRVRWREAEVADYIETLQKHKLSLRLMLKIIQCHTVAEASRSLGKLHEAVTQISIQLQAFIENSNPPVCKEFHGQPLAIDIQPQHTGVSATTDSKASSSSTLGGGKEVSDNRSKESAASKRPVVTFRNSLSLRSIRFKSPFFIDGLKNSSTYKRIQNWAASSGSCSIPSSSRDSPAGAGWSAFSDINLGELSIWQVSMIELPLCLSDLWDLKPYQIQSSATIGRSEAHRQLNSKWSPRGRIHSAISNGHAYVVQNLLALGADIEERDSEGRTPLANAAYTNQISICKLLVARGASVTGHMHNAIRDENETSIYVLLKLGANKEELDSEGRTPLIYAVYMGRESICKLFLECGANLEAQDSKGRVPLAYAIQRGQDNICKLLLEYGASLEAKDLKGRTPLIYAVYLGHADTCKLLLERGANLEAIDAYGRTPLTHAALMGRESICKLLLEGGEPMLMTAISTVFKINLTGHIHNAIFHGNEHVVQALLASGADIEERDSEGRTPLTYAIHIGRDSICDLLFVRGAGVNARYPQHRTLPDYTNNIHREEVYKLLMKRWEPVKSPSSNASRDNFNPIHYAIYNGDSNDIRNLLASGTNIEEMDAEGRTLLTYAIHIGQENICILLLECGANLEAKDSKGRTALTYAVYMGRKSICKLLLHYGANLGAEDSQGRTPLIYAVYLGQEDSCKLLLERGANLEAMDSHERTPLTYAALMGRESICKLLLERGANLEAMDSHGRTPLTYAALMGRESICKQLLARGESMSVTVASVVLKINLTGRIHNAIYHGNQYVVQALLALGANIEELDSEGRTPLIYAVYMDRESICASLLLHGANINARDPQNRIPLDYAKFMNRENIWKLLWEDWGKPVETSTSNAIRGKLNSIHHAIYNGDSKAVQDLLASGTNVEEMDSEGRTPLIYAVYLGQEGICKLLLERGANLEAMDSEGRTPLTHAIYLNKENILQLLLERAATAGTPVASIVSQVNLTGRIFKAIREGNEAMVRGLLAMGIDVEERSQNEWRMTPLLLAIYCNQPAIARFLIEKGADLFARDCNQWTVLHCAVFDNKRDPEMLVELLEHGAGMLIDERSNAGRTALHYCGMSLTLTKVLVEHGASLNIQNGNGETPYQTAVRYGCSDVARYLWFQLSPDEKVLYTPPPM